MTVTCDVLLRFISTNRDHYTVAAPIIETRYLSAAELRDLRLQATSAARDLPSSLRSREFVAGIVQGTFGSTGIMPEKMGSAPTPSLPESVAASVPTERQGVFGFHEILAIWGTALCPLRCPHCMFGTQLEERDLPDQEHLLDWISQAALHRIQLISLTGGEVFCAFQKLQSAVAHAASLGLQVNVVTNAYWATSPECARRQLRKLTGLTDLAVSVDEFHMKRVPVSCAINAAHEAYALGIRVVLTVAHCRRESFLRFKQWLEYQLEVPVPIVPIQVVRQGNAEQLSPELFDWDECMPRGTCYRANVPMVDKNGTVYACCAPPLDCALAAHSLRLGNLHEEPLADILVRAEESAYIQALRVWGPGYLAQLAIKKGLGQQLRRRYPRGSICEVCYDLLRDAEVISAVTKALEDPVLQREIALRRTCFFAETTAVGR